MCFVLPIISTGELQHFRTYGRASPPEAGPPDTRDFSTASRICPFGFDEFYGVINGVPSGNLT